MSDIRSGGHWTMEDYYQRITTKQWREMLLNEHDRLIYNGRLRTLQGKKIGPGVYEISKKPLEG
jgi:hypothetical protein